jgi:hypothetical protein
MTESGVRAAARSMDREERLSLCCCEDACRFHMTSFVVVVEQETMDVLKAAFVSVICRRAADLHGGVFVWVRDTVAYKRMHPFFDLPRTGSHTMAHGSEEQTDESK